MLVGVITTTYNMDCLSQFVQLGGAILDDWLQEVRRRKFRDSGSPKEADKSYNNLFFASLEGKK